MAAATGTFSLWTYQQKEKNMMMMIAGLGWGLRRKRLIIAVFLASMVVFAPILCRAEASTYNQTQKDGSDQASMQNLSGYKRVWPEMKFGWKVVVGSIVGFLGAAFGTAGGVGGGGIFVLMLHVIIGFDTKSSTAISTCMISGAAGATVHYNLKRRHPVLDIPVIDYDLALLFQPMLILGVSIGVSLNVIFAEWMICLLLLALYIVISTRTFFKGVETWKKETITIKEIARCLESNGDNGVQVINATTTTKKSTVPILENVHWKELGLLVGVWLVILAVQIGKNYTKTCSKAYWILNITQVPVATAVTAYHAVSLYTGRRTIASWGEKGQKWRAHQLVFYCVVGLLVGAVGGLLGIGGGFLLGPIFIEMGVPPRVSTVTSTFAMTFSALMSAIEYYLLKRFPLSYTTYLFAVATFAGFAGQHVVQKLMDKLRRASIVIFTLSFTLFISGVSIGGVGIANMVRKVQQKEYIGFNSLCSASRFAEQVQT